MARIRTIKPEFFTSADIVELTPLARLFYVSLWCEADREGRLSWNAKTLKMRYMPADDCDINALAEELTEAKLLIIYEVDDKQYAEIPSFKTHQVINNRETESVIPPRVKDASPRVKAEGKEGREGKGTRVKGTRLSQDWKLPDEWYKEAHDINQSLSKDRIKEISEEFKDHWLSTAGEKGVKLDWLATWRNWIRRQREYAFGGNNKPNKNGVVI